MFLQIIALIIKAIHRNRIGAGLATVGLGAEGFSSNSSFAGDRCSGPRSGLSLGFTSVSAPGSNVYILCPILPFAMTNPTPEQKAVVADAMRFIEKCLERGQTDLEISEMALDIYKWVLRDCDITMCRNILLKKGLDAPIQMAAETVIDIPTRIASDVIDGSMYAFQLTWWFPIIIIGGMTIIFLGLAELKLSQNRENCSAPDSNLGLDDTTQYSALENFTFSLAIPQTMLFFCILFILGHRLVNIYIFPVSFILFTGILTPFIICGSLVILFPIMSFLIMVIFSSVLLVMCFNWEVYSGFQARRKRLLYELLLIMKQHGFLDLCSFAYINFFCVSAQRNRIFIGILLFFNILYIVCSRYYFLIKFPGYSFDYIIEPFFLYSLLLISLLFLYLRLFITLSSSVTLTTKAYYPHLLHSDILFILGEGVDIPTATPVPPVPAPIPTPTPRVPVVPPATPKYSLINVSYNRAYHKNYYSEAFQSSIRLRNIGVIVGVMGVGVGIATAKFSYDAATAAQQQVEIGKEQVRAQETNNDEMGRQNKLEELAQGICTKEEYLAEYPPRSSVNKKN